jgi:hypothetical protein
MNRLKGCSICSVVNSVLGGFATRKAFTKRRGIKYVNLKWIPIITASGVLRLV